MYKYACDRLLEVMTNRITDILPYDRPVSELFAQKMYRVEVKCGRRGGGCREGEYPVREDDITLCVVN